MSLILEALKKSEANRRLGQAPDLGTPFTPARRGRSPLWAMLVIVLALGAGAWWWFGGGTPAPVPAAPQPSNAVTQAPVRTAAPEQHREAQQQEDRRIFNSAQRRDAIVKASMAVNRDEQMRLTAQRRDAMERMAKRPSLLAPGSNAQTPTAPVRIAELERTPQAADMQGNTLSAQPRPEAGQPHPEAGQQHPEAGQPHPEAGQPHPEAAAPQPAPGTPKLDVPAYYDLPFATRKALPQLSMSMHVYTADPKQRFVILDGARMVEGDTTTDSVTLREIRPDGVILEFQGQRFFFPRDGL
jgi:general secretion pathway protein B